MPFALGSAAARFPRLVPGLDFKSSVERVAAFQAGSIPVPRRHSIGPRVSRDRTSNEARRDVGWCGFMSGVGAIPDEVGRCYAVVESARAAKRSRSAE